MFQSTIAIAFLGTPHGGSDLASWVTIPAKALGVLKSINTDLLSVLQINSEVLYRIQNDFLSLVRDLREQDRSLKITCFFESLSMPHVGTIVARPSASLAGYNTISIHANHRDMVKFNIADDLGFLSVLGELRRWVGDVGYSSQTISRVNVSAKELNQEKNECLKSLAFVEIDSRKANIDSPNPKTCEWIFNNSRYKLWETPNSGPGSRNVLWIKGKPGSGKSTLMKRITLEHDKKALTASIFCFSFFFNARGAELENSPLGLYRSLLFQLLQKSKALMEGFLPRFLQKEPQCQGNKVIWQIREISEFFHSAISEMHSRPIYIFIDALDECEEDEVRKIVKNLEDCSAAAVSNGAILKIGVSSRHYPHISLRTITGQEIFLENHNGLDIHRYVLQELNIHEQNLRAELITGLIRKPAGIFFWTSFMVRRLLKASDQGYSADKMKALLDNVPPSLEGLFVEILTCVDLDRQASMTLLAPWVICALRPLLLYELHVALAFSTNEPPLSLMDPKIRTGFDAERFRKCLIDASGGLFETVWINGREVVQVIHDSVRGFFLESEEAVKIMKLPAGKRFLEYGHEQIVAACGRYFHIMELRRCLPLPKRNGYVAVEEMVAMLYKPVMVPFDDFTPYDTTYFHDSVFIHIKKTFHSSVADLESRDGPVSKSPRKILEGWLVFLYYLIVQTGALSSLQSETLDILQQNTSMISLSVPQFSRMTTCIDNLVIFVNKVMKDGFVLKETSGSRCRDLEIAADSSIYLRWFWKGVLRTPPGSITYHNRSDGSWVAYPNTMALDRILELGNSDHTRLGFGFCLVAGKSHRLTDLENSWSHRQFPSCTVPLQDWQILRSWNSEHSGTESLSEILIPFQIPHFKTDFRVGRR